MPTIKKLANIVLTSSLDQPVVAMQAARNVKSGNFSEADRAVLETWWKAGYAF